MRICFAMTLFLMVASLNRLRRWRAREDLSFALAAPYTRIESQNKWEREGIRNSTWRYPLVDRAMLHEVQYLFKDDIPPNSNNLSSNDQVQWQPRVTRLPEEPSRSRSADENARITRIVEEGICETPAHPQPCRFLFPVRIAEQESKARIHFFQLAQLASHLNRTLVLPKVGKSKIGACFRWSFETYYDLNSLNSALSNAPAVVDQEDFQVWLEELGRHEYPSTRLFLVGPSPSPQLTISKDDRIRVSHVEPYDGWKTDLPGCLSKSRWLEDVYPSFMTVAQPTHGGGSNLLSEAMIATLSDDSLSNTDGYPASPTRLLMLDWNLRYPLFPPSYNRQLRYSPKLVGLARQLAPSSAYLAVHWRMETVDPSLLITCAHALVDLLVRLLHGESLALNVTTVWFASDYPYPIARRTRTQPRPALEGKSGTFREFEIRHEEAIQVLRKAFEDGGELERWKVTDISAAMESHVVDKELLNDAGILGIVDKLIGIQANLFVSGSNRCARRSSFTTQIINERKNTRRREDFLDGNIVDTFG